MKARALIALWLTVPVLAGAAETVALSTGAALSTATLTCDDLDYFTEANRLEARGNALLISSGTRLRADALTLVPAARTAEASGRVVLKDDVLTLFADRVSYDWAQSTGSLREVFLRQGQWRVWGREVERLGPNLFRLRRAAFTSCDRDPPHYHFRGGNAVYRVDERMSVSHVRFALEKTPLLWVPFYSRSLKDNRWALTVDPGNSARNGLTTRTVFSYPLGKNIRASALWDYFSRAGHGLGGELTYTEPTARGSLSAYVIRDRIADDRRWNLRFAHWQQWSPRWQVQSNVAFQSDEEVNNTFIRDDYQRRRQLGESDVAFTHTAPWFTARIVAEHDRALDVPGDRFVTARTVLPRVSAQTSALRVGRSSLYFQGSANFESSYDRPEVVAGTPNPILTGKDAVRQSADSTASLRWRWPLSKTISIEPSAGLTEQWRSHREEPLALDPRDLFQGRGFTGLNWRHRLTSALDYDLTHRYQVRWRPDTWSRDHAALDQGEERNEVSFFGSWRPSSAVWARLTTAYDFRDAPGLGFLTPRQRVAPPSLDVTLRPSRRWSATWRETAQLHPVRKTQSRQVSFRAGPSDRAFVSSGFSYNVGRAGQLDLNHAAAFSLTRGWWLSGDIHYTAEGAGRTRYNHVTFKEKNVVVRRDLHCWVVRVTYRERPGVNELYFRLDLKTNAQWRESQRLEGEAQYYPARETRGDY